MIEREDIELSGAINVWDLVIGRLGYNSFGLHRPFILGSARMAILVDGRPGSGSTSTIDLDALPISAVERIEILSDSAAALHGGHAIGGAINIVLRHDFEGAEARLSGERPSEAGGDSEHASVLWGGAIGDGHMVIGADTLRRDEIHNADREFSRARWTPGGSFADTAGVSVGGNTVIIPTSGGTIARPIGECTGSAYTGTLANPYGLPGSGCGFAYDNIAWGWERRERETVFLELDHPLGEDGELYANARYARTDRFEPRYAPSVGTFRFEPSQMLKDALLADPEIDALPVNDEGRTLLTVVHRFVGHGNRDWRWDADDHELTLGVRRRLAEATGYDAYVQIRRYDADVDGGTFVRESAIQEEIQAGRYNLENPFSTDTAHLEAVRKSGLRLDRNVAHTEKVAGVSLDGRALALPGGDVRWAVGTEFASEEARDRYDYRDVHNRSYKADDVLGSGGSEYSGDRRRWSAFAETSLPLHRDLDVGLAGRHDEFDDVGATFSHQVSSRYRLNDVVMVRGSWSGSSRAPGLNQLHRETIDYPFVCDTKTFAGDPKDCPIEQVERRSGGNPNLDPDDAESFSLGAGANVGPLSMSADWFRIELSDAPAALSPQIIVDQDAMGRLPSGAAVVRGDNGLIERIEQPVGLVNSGETDVTGIDLRARTEWHAASTDMVLDARWIHVSRREGRVSGVKQPGDHPRDRIHASLRASRGDVTALWSVYGLSGYWNSRRTARYDRWIGHDVALRWQDAFGLSGMDLVGGVLNVGDRGPSTDPTSPGTEGAATTLDNIRGRTLFLTAKVSFDP